MPELDIIIPVYNEGKNIISTLTAIRRSVRTPARVLICYDFDEDDTLPAVKANAAVYAPLQVFFVKNPGRGAHAAVMAGFAASKAPYVLMYAADDDYNAGILDSMVAQARAGADVVCASRFMPGGSMQGCPFLKALLVRVGNGVLYYLGRVPTRDASNGFRLFSRRVITEIPVESTQGFTYSIELLVKTHRLGWGIASVPARWYERVQGTSRFKIIAWLPAYLRWVWYAFSTTYWHQYRALTVAVGVAVLLALLPVFNAAVYIGSDWRGVIPSYGDEVLYFNQVHEIADGHFLYGNQYLLEHAGGPPLVFFAGHWLAALPLGLGMPFVPAMVFNDVLWSMIFVGLGFWLLRELSLPKVWSAAGSLLSYLSCYGLMLRPSSRQEVYPFFLLFYIALVRLLKEPERRSSIIFLGLTTAATFYVFSYLWQIAIITLGLLFLYALARRQYVLARSTLYASLLGVVVGAPQLLYMVYLSRTYPYFLEAIARFGLVTTHLPEAEIIYSGGWVGVLLLLAAFVWWRMPTVRHSPAFYLWGVFAATAGFGLWFMEGSNLITGKLLETGEHIRPFIGPWLALAVVPFSYLLWRMKSVLQWWERGVVVVVGVALLCGIGIFVDRYFLSYVHPTQLVPLWKEEQGFAAPLQWVDTQQQAPVVIWVDPSAPIAAYIPTLSRDYMLYAQGALWTLTPDSELHERYLVAEYFNNPGVGELKSHFDDYVGRQDAFHHAKTIERGIKLCRIIYYFDKGHECGTPPTSIELLGESFFAGLEQQFVHDIKPHIKTYLQKYHVSYIIKDTVLNPQWAPEALGAKKVWSDARYEIYRL